jgi:Flp pilus assembly CpaE family ATPase
MSFALNTAASELPFAAFVCTESGEALARDVITASGAPSGALLGGGLSGAARAAQQSPGAQMVLTELDLPLERACAVVSRLRQGGTSVLVFGQDLSIQTYRALRGAGALEYFPMPVSAEEILSFEVTMPPAANVAEPIGQTHRTIGVIGTNGGVGASAFAANLAYMAASPKHEGRKTALVDADVQFGSIALDLDRDGTPGLLDALSGPDRIDATFLDGTMDHLSDTLALYSLANDLQAGGCQGSHFWPDMMRRVTQEFSTTIFDLPRNLILQTPDVLKALDAAILVVPAGYAGVSAAVRLVAYLRQEHPRLTLTFVLSDVRKDAQLSPSDIAKALGLDMAAVLPRCDAQMLRAQRKGRTVAELYPRMAYSKACHTVLDRVASGDAAERKSTGLIRKVFG